MEIALVFEVFMKNSTCIFGEILLVLRINTSDVNRAVISYTKHKQ